MSHRIPFISILLALGWVIPCRAADTDFFEQRIRPILVDECYKCHSRASEKVMGGLLLDSRAGLMQGGDNGPAVVPGDPAGSRLIVAVRFKDPDLQMPPKKQLTEQQVADLTAWVKAGAPMPPDDPAKVASSQPYDFEAARKQWAFHVPQDPPVPAAKHRDWARTPIDAFVLSKLEAAGLLPAPPADKRTLIRRATFDLTGLPPTRQQVDAFLADDSPNAFAKVVDRLLASPAYGQKWARHWLDLVRYTDAFDARGIGGEADVPFAWRYRDWVIDAFNRDLPYDQFVRMQIAGDLLPGSSADGIVATGMYAIGNWPGGDADKEKMLTDIVDDQIDVTGRVFLGLTLACARCHDHKFDPVPTADYYSLAGIFFSSHILPGPGAKTAGSPVLRIPLVPASEIELRKKQAAQLAELQKRVDEFPAAARVEMAQEELARTDRYLNAAWRVRGLSPEKAAAALEDAATRERLDRGLLRRWATLAGVPTADTATRKLLTKPMTRVAGLAGVDGWIGGDGRPCPCVTANANDHPVSFSTLDLPAKCVTVHPGPSSAVAVAWRSPIDGTVRVRGRVADADNHCGDGVTWRLEHVLPGRALVLIGGEITNGGAQAFPEEADATLDRVTVHRGELLELVIDRKAEYTCDTTVVELRITEQGGGRTWDLARELAAGVTAGNPHADAAGNAGVWQFHERLGDVAVVVVSGTAAKWAALVSSADVKEEDLAASAASVRDALVAARSKADAARVRGIDPTKDATLRADADVRFYLGLVTPKGPFWGGVTATEKDVGPAELQRLAAMKEELAAAKRDALPPVPLAHGLQEGGTPNTGYAGIHDAKIQIRGRYDRLGDLVLRRFPRLLAGDSQRPVGEITSGSGRAELADWIANPGNPLTARVMVNRLWQNHFGEAIVRTASNFGKLGTPPTHPELLDYLAHRFVESGWSIKAMHRMMMLSATYQQAGVPGAATYKADPDNQLFARMPRRRLQAEELRDSLLAVAGTLDAAAGGPSVNDLNARRRTLYLTTIRSDRSSYRVLFDAADPTAVIDRRIDSTVAPQALFLMNNPFVLGRAKELADLLESQGLKEDRAKVDWLYQRLYGRAATEEEVGIGLTAASQDSVAYCQVLLCANEFMYVD